MASEIFSLIYDGQEIRNGEMDVSALGPALVAMGELFAIANTSLNGTHATVETKVKANFKEGSFEVFYHIHQLLNDPTAGVIPGLYVLSANDLVGQVVGKVVDKAKDKVSDFAVEGLFKLLARLGGKKPKDTTYDETNNIFIFNTGDNVKISVDQPTGKLYKDRRIQSAAARVAAPLNRSGIDELRIERDSEEIASLARNDFPEIAEIDLVHTPSISTSSSGGESPQEMIVRIIKPAFSDGKWAVSDGSKPFQVSMEDQEFKARVHAREVGFYDGDLYRVEMVTSQKVNGRGLSTERKIVRVIAPLPSHFQESLGLPVPMPDEPKTVKMRKKVSKKSNAEN